MKKFKKIGACVFIALIAFFRISNGLIVEAKADGSTYYPAEIMLGTFFTSEKDMTDTLYVSFDGFTFHKIGEAYTDKYPNSRSINQIVGYGESQILDIVDDIPTLDTEKSIIGCFHDPGLMYKDGYFWMMTGTPDHSVKPNQFIPIWGYSKDLIHWSYGNSGKENESNVLFPEIKYPIEGDQNRFDCVAPDTFLDDNGDVWIIVSAGYFAQWNGGESVDDKMSPYLIPVHNLSVNKGKINDIIADAESKHTDAYTLQHEIRCVQPIADYGTPIPINLPDYLIDELDGECDDRIDGSLYKEDGTYYLTVKRNGVTNEIWSIDNLNDVSNPEAWTLINSDFLYEYEGPCMTKFNGDYYVYSDKLSKIPGAEGGDNTGIYVSCAAAIDQPWTVQTKVTLLDYNGNSVDGRHGSVITLQRGEDSYNTVINQYIEVYGSLDNAIVEQPKSVTMNGLFRSNGEFYLYENGAMVTSQEVYDAKTDAWYWFDADGTMARSKSVYIPCTEDRSEAKWVYYDSQGNMLYGEQCINGNWYRFEESTGKMIHGEYCTAEGNWYYYDEITGIMHHGWTSLPDGRVYYYNEITGIRE